MTEDEFNSMMKESGLELYGLGKDRFKFISVCTIFAKLVATHTLANVDPSSFISYQEGFEVGNKLAIDGFCKQLRQLHDAYSCTSDSSTLRSKGKA